LTNGTIQKGSGDWTQYRELENVIEIEIDEFHHDARAGRREFSHDELISGKCRAAELNRWGREDPASRISMPSICRSGSTIRMSLKSGRSW
jgi:hypothetical protein